VGVGWYIHIVSANTADLKTLEKGLGNIKTAIVESTKKTESFQQELIYEHTAALKRIESADKSWNVKHEEILKRIDQNGQQMNKNQQTIM